MVIIPTAGGEQGFLTPIYVPFATPTSTFFVTVVWYVEECIVGSALALAWERCQKVENVLNAWAKDLVKGT
ncbi:hypothetical protein K7X08_011808 [Anisodus acutangulus]|uniref:Uncharacterized protein n=1 Tax=Anisodus acutangulus TaxID=402998 RepID=A0A9Q1RL94_9SOLA|nr:hypothetical protein K7X08_011808 [Anisodus acutangulus]